MKEKEDTKRFIRIVYEDAGKISRDAIIPILDYYENESYAENMERAAEDILEQGGFWLNLTTIIPYHKIQSINAHKPPFEGDKNQRPKRVDRRMGPSRKIVTTTTSTEKPIVEQVEKLVENVH